MPAAENTACLVKALNEPDPKCYSEAENSLCSNEWRKGI